MITVAALEILLETEGYESHVFPTDYVGEKRRTECGAEYDVDQLGPTGDTTPECENCQLAYGTYIAQRLEEQVPVTQARLRDLLDDMPEGAWAS
ncbi:hypothetical protein [Lentzea atacamensis]|uniref:hypothetical protein n=1 Tax=Lentzea atacamensis TaxID=531938 RepID=UPI0011B4EF18|nr:hypothetical protein [Lentzea atacamensis]